MKFTDYKTGWTISIMNNEAIHWNLHSWGPSGKHMEDRWYISDEDMRSLYECPKFKELVKKEVKRAF